jgi:hypothetical protein
VVQPQSSAAGPEFETSKVTSLHEEDTNPQDVVAGVPTRSMFQTDAVAPKVTVQAAWAMRVTGHVQVINGATW